MRVLVLNAGSSSLKASIVVDGNATMRSAVDWGADATRAAGRRTAVDRIIAELVADTTLDGVGHRVVHGGTAFTRPTLVDDGVLERLRSLIPLAPLHNAVAIETIEAARVALPTVPHLATFDTAFHAGLPETQVHYPLPLRWRTEWGVRRYGFHGLSVEWAVERAGSLLDRPVDRLRLVVAHLGSGCSVTAVDRGRSVATSMGMTPLEGLMMGTRAGSIDPGILLTVLRDHRIDLDALDDALEHGAGLVALAGTSDVAELEARAGRADDAARRALAMFAERAAAGIAAAASALDTLDAVAFTGGIGEHAAATRAAIVSRLGVLGLESIPSRPTTKDTVLSRPGSAVAVVRIEAREDLVIARHAERALLALRSSSLTDKAGSSAPASHGEPDDDRTDRRARAH